MHALLLAALLIGTPGQDPRAAPITRTELTDIARKEPISSPVHDQLISRAKWSSLAADAYALYAGLASSSPRDGRAHLLCAVAAQAYWVQDRDKAPRGVIEAVYRRMVGEYKEAARLVPHSPGVDRAYGYFLWQYDGRLAEGLKRVRRAAEADPGNPEAHELLGAIYMNPSGNAYDAHKAEAALQQAIRLDPSYAMPRFDLAVLYANTRRRAEAVRQLDTFVGLLPPGGEERRMVKALRRALPRSKAPAT